MVARSGSQAGRFTPGELVRVAVAADGSVAAIHERARITVVELPDLAAVAEIGVDPEALASEVAWLGAPPRLLVVSRYAAHSTAHLLEPRGPETIAEIRLEAPMRLYAAVGAAALVAGAPGAAVLVASDAHLTPYQVPTRAVPLAAGAAGARFMVALPASIEEWDPQSRMPRRRLRLPRAAAITAVGGSDRVVWLTTQQDPERIDVIPLVNRVQPRTHELPEPIASVAGHPRSELVACIGARTGRIYLVDLEGRTGLRVLAAPGIERVASAGLVIGRAPGGPAGMPGALPGGLAGVLAGQAHHPIAMLSIDAGDSDAALAPIAAPRAGEPAAVSAVRSRAAGDAADDAREAEPSARAGSAVPPAGDRSARAGVAAAAAPVARPRPPSAPPLAPSGPAGATGAPPWPAAPPAGHPAARAVAAARAAASMRERFSAWRDLVRQDQAPAGRGAPAPAPSLAAARGEVRHSWRDEVVAWTRASASGAIEHDVPAAPAIDAVMARFDLAASLYPVVVRLYGAHLCGQRGVAPAEVSRLHDRQWDEALGRGELAARGVAAYAGSRVALSPVVARVLDELTPLTGALIGEPGSVALLGPCVVVAGDEPLAAIAERCRGRVGGAILAARGTPELAALVLEARAYGAAAMLRPAGLAEAPSEPAIFVVADPELADRLGMPRLA